MSRGVPSYNMTSCSSVNRSKKCFLHTSKYFRERKKRSTSRRSLFILFPSFKAPLEEALQQLCQRPHVALQKNKQPHIFPQSFFPADKIEAQKKKSHSNNNSSQQHQQFFPKKNFPQKKFFLKKNSSRKFFFSTKKTIFKTELRSFDAGEEAVLSSTFTLFTVPLFTVLSVSANAASISRCLSVSFFGTLILMWT